jgi:ABC-type ATPase involved in cell division
VIVGLLPELLSGLEEYRLLFFGALLLLVLWVAPGGVTGALRGLARRTGSGLAAREAAANPATADVMLSRRSRRTLRAESLGMVFGGVRAVDKLSFDVPPAAITSLIGPNGAGKTTALNMLSGFYRPTSGSFALDGTPLQGKAAFRIARQGIARTYQTSQLFGSLSVEDNVALAVSRGRLGHLLDAARLNAPQVRAVSRRLLAYCGYLGALDIPAADLAHVDRRLVEIARARAGSGQPGHRLWRRTGAPRHYLAGQARRNGSRSGCERRR